MRTTTSTTLDSFFLLRRRGTGLSERTVTVAYAAGRHESRSNFIVAHGVGITGDTWHDVVE